MERAVFYDETDEMDETIFSRSCFSLAVRGFFYGYGIGGGRRSWGDSEHMGRRIKAVVNGVVFPAIDLILAVLFFIKLGSSWFEYRKNGHFELAAPAILFASLVLMLTCPLYIWGILGM